MIYFRYTSAAAIYQMIYAHFTGLCVLYKWYILVTRMNLPYINLYMLISLVYVYYINDIFSLHECGSHISIYIYSFHRCGYHISIDNNPFHLLSGNLLIYRKQSRRWNVLQSGRLSSYNILFRIRFARRNSVNTRSKSFWTDYLTLCKAQNWK